MMQVLYERGYIDVNNHKRYSKNGKKNDFDENTKELKEECTKYSLTYLLSQCSDFKNQKTDIEQLCNELSYGNNYSFKIVAVFFIQL